MDIQFARLMVEVSRVGERVTAQFDEAPVAAREVRQDEAANSTGSRAARFGWMGQLVGVLRPSRA